MAGVTKKYTLLSAVPLLVLSLGLSPAMAVEPVRFSGELSGLVTDPAGKPTPNATVSLFNKQDRLLQRMQADALGTFSFGDLLPDLYTVRVSLNTFLPAFKEHVLVRPGMRSLVEVNLTHLYSSIVLLSTTPAPGGLMSDSWKWALRTDAARRPILRLIPVGKPRVEKSPDEDKTPLFTESRGLVRVSASDGAQAPGAANEADLGTQFAFATSLHGSNHLQLSGNVGFTPGNGAPAAGFRTTFQRDFAIASPEISVTMRQLSVPLRSGMASEIGVPSLRTIAVSVADHTDLTDSLRLDYGFEMDMISFMSRLHYFSPYAKAAYTIPHGTVDFTWTSGNARPELGLAGGDANSQFQRELLSLAMVPKVSLLNGAAKVQRGDDYELGVSQRFGSREYRVAAYREVVSNTALAISGTGNGDLFAGDLLPDIFSNSVVFNAGRFASNGYSASFTQDLTENYRLSFTAGSEGVLLPNGNRIAGSSAEDLRGILVSRQRPSVTLRAMGTVKETGTRFSTSYEWTDSRSATPAQMYSTQSAKQEPGFNIYIRQPIANIPGLPWRLEATADFRNLLAQGYLPLNLADGRRLVLVPNPRSFRGGLAFVF